MYLYDTEVEILVNGKPVKKFSHEGRTYIQANKGSAYSIKIRNNSWKRRMFNVSVDGINVVNGEAAGKSPFGYVLNGYSTYEIQGFRTSNEEVHPFKFNDKQKSYAAKSEETQGDVSNCGVIGVQVYEEKEKPAPIVVSRPIVPFWEEPRYGSPSWTGDFTVTCGASNNMLREATNLYSQGVGARGMSSGGGTQSCCFMSFSAPTPESEVVEGGFDLGTEFSKEAITDKVTNTSFEIGELLVTVEIFYSSREGLTKMGVPVFREVKVAAPSAFPTRFCKPPKN
jgi:hypothetical protein